jgi:hypothetical protein
MYPTLLNAKPIEKLKLELLYDNNEVRIIDMSLYCKTDYFRQLENWNYFQRVMIRNGVVTWPKEQDIAPETLYLDSKPV